LIALLLPAVQAAREAARQQYSATLLTLNAYEKQNYTFTLPFSDTHSLRKIVQAGDIRHGGDNKMLFIYFLT
jgi:hypothetical protein